MLKKKAAERFGIPPFREQVLERRVPETPWYQGDGATLVTLLLVQVITGVTMTLYYANGADVAYDSVRYITRDLEMGWLIRALHFWSAGFMVIMLLSHVFRHLALGGYKAPREGTWYIGVFQFFLVLTMSFTGYVLRWDERAVYAVGVVLNMLHRVPLIGDELVLLVQGAPQIGALTLTRFYSVHVWIVPLLLIGLVAIHLYLVVLHGVTAKAEHEQPVRTAEQQKKVYKEAAHSADRGEWFHPTAMAKIGTMAFIIFAIAYGVAVLQGPRQLYPEANLIQSSVPQEEWWFWWYSALIAYLPPFVAPVFYVAFPLALFIGMLLLPLLDRGANRGVRKRPVWTAMVVLSVLGLLWLSSQRIKSPWTGWPSEVAPPVPTGVTISAEAERGRGLFVHYGCNSCHAVSGQGRSVGPDLARLSHPLSKVELRNFILQPTEDVAMPSYRGRITEDDLDDVAEFVLVAQTFPREEGATGK